MTPREVRADFTGDPTSASQARRFVDATLRSWSCDALLEIATLLVSELVSNAVLHAGTSIRVVIRVSHGRLRFEVHDGDARLPARKHYSMLSATGRGLLMVERMADDWGVEPEGHGKAVWFELDSKAASTTPEFGTFDFGHFDLDAIDEVGTEGTGRERGTEGGGAGGRAGPRALVVAGRR